MTEILDLTAFSFPAQIDSIFVLSSTTGYTVHLFTSATYAVLHDHEPFVDDNNNIPINSQAQNLAHSIWLISVEISGR